MKPRPAGRPGPRGMTAGVLGTILVHGAVLGLLIGAVRPPRMLPPAYAVELVAAPRPTPKKRLAPEALPTPPAPSPPASTPESKTKKPAPVKAPPKKTVPKPSTKPAPPVPTPEPEPTPPPEAAPKPAETPPAAEEREAPAETRSETAPLPNETPSTGTDVANVKTPGLDFPFPEYLRNVVSQVYRRWDRPVTERNRYAEISFFVLRDGSVRDIRFAKSSGNFSFDLDAQGAIEAAGNARAFGPLPEGYEADVLPVTFYFRLQ